jgi:hypothetical protein
MTIQLDQIYRSTRDGRRVRIADLPGTTPGAPDFCMVAVYTVLDNGRETRYRRVGCEQFHDSPTTQDGKPRRTGYVLETHA